MTSRSHPLRLLSALHRDERGQALPLLVALSMVFVLMAVLVIDFGQMFGDRREAQRASDLAALASAQALPWGPDDPARSVKLAAADAVARDYLTLNGYNPDDTDVVTSITTNYAGDPTQVEVRVQRPSNWHFASIFGIADPMIGARAVAQLHTQPAEYGIMALNHTACEAFKVEGTVQLRVVGGGIVENSSCSTDAVDISGQVTVESAQFDMYFEGGTSISQNTTVDPEPWPLGWRVDDPLAGLTEPSLANLPISPDSGGTAATPALRLIQGGGAPVTLRPGVYYGGLAISSSRSVTFERGLYVMAGGGLSISGSGQLTGSEVTFFNTTYGGACGPISLQGSRPLLFTPPTSGPYEGITFWQSSSCSQTMLHAGTVDGVAGVFYLPNARYELAGDGVMTGVQVIASTVLVRGNGAVTINYENGITADVWTVSLLE